MNDPVLHRKIFREKALKSGALKPLKYQLGTEVSFNPFITTEDRNISYMLPKVTGSSIATGIKGIGSLIKGAPGYAAVEGAATLAGVPENVSLGALIASGFADSPTARGAFQGAGIKNLLGRGVVRALALPSRAATILNPYALAAFPLIYEYIHQDKMKNDPEYRNKVLKQRDENESSKFYDSDSAMMGYKEFPLKSPETTTTGIIKGKIGKTTSGNGGTPPTNGTPPSETPFNLNPGGGRDLSKLENKIADSFNKTIEDSKVNGVNGVNGVKKINDTKPLSFFNKTGDFARSASGNAFLLKFAAGLISGKGGFGEVVGNALNPAVDLFAAYKLKEDEIANEQFTEMMKLQAEAEKASKVEIERDNGSFPIVNSDGSISYVAASRNKKTGTVETYTRDADNKLVVTSIPSDLVSLFAIKSPEYKAGLEEAVASYGSVATGLGLLEYVKRVDKSVLGTSGKIKDFANTLLGIGKGALDSFSTIDPVFIDKGTEKKLEGDELKKAQNLWKGLDEKTSTFFDELDKTSIDELGKLKVTQTTLKYYLANAFKDKDRLTNTDLQLVADLVDIVTFSGAEQVEAKLAALEGVLRDKQKELKKKINSYGVTDTEFAIKFYGTPGAINAVGFGFASENPIGGGGKTDYKNLTVKEREKLLNDLGF